MKTITCYCENTFKVDIPDIIDLNKEPDVVDKILDGSFLSITCPRCETVLKPEFTIRFIDSQRNLDLLYISEIERDSYLSGRTSYTAERIVIGFAELQEKFRILREELDDKAVEMIKAYLISRAEDGPTLKIYFAGIEESKLVFHIDGLEDDKTAVTHISLGLYKKLKNAIAENTIDPALTDVLSPPYISVNKIQTMRD